MVWPCPRGGSHFTLILSVSSFTDMFAGWRGLVKITPSVDWSAVHLVKSVIEQSSTLYFSPGSRPSARCSVASFGSQISSGSSVSGTLFVTCRYFLSGFGVDLHGRTLRLYLWKSPLGGVQLNRAVARLFAKVIDGWTVRFCGGKGGRNCCIATPFILALPMMAETVTVYSVVPPLKFLNSTSLQSSARV